ncbi:MAG: L-fuconolactonase [Paracoccaceae bacterium]|jgi:L-fuconolactonase
MIDPDWMPRMAQREDWLALVTEDIIDPAREIVDPHHHLWDRQGRIYEMGELAADTGSGHNVVQTVYIECRSYWDTTGAENLRPVGETKRVAEMAAGSDAKAQIAGIIGFADLRDVGLDKVLVAHKAAGQGLLRGIRQSGAWDRDPDALAIVGRGVPEQYNDPDFRRGMALLAEHGLTYDTWHYHHQADDFLALARAVPGTVMVLDHLSTPLGVGRFTGQRDVIFARWQDDMAALAECPNVRAKLGGLAMADNGWGWQDRDVPPTSDEFVAAYGDWYHHMIGCFGPERCMFESNFPVDRISISYHVLWNAFKKIAARYSEAEQAMMFAGTARKVYGL